MQLVYESKEAIPAESADNFVEFDQNGKTVHMHKDLAESKKSEFRYQGQMSKMQESFNGLNSRVEQFETEKKAAAEEAANKARAEALEKYKAENNFDGALQLEQEKFQSTLSAKELELKSAHDRVTELQNSILNGQKQSMAMKVAQAYAPPQFVEAVSELLTNRRFKDADGQAAFTNNGGEAVKFDVDLIMEELSHDPIFKPFAKGPGSKPGYSSNGGNGEAGRGNLISREAFDAMSPTDKKAFSLKGGKIA